jgi:hypothetical protein
MKKRKDCGSIHNYKAGAKKFLSFIMGINRKEKGNESKNEKTGCKILCVCRYYNDGSVYVFYAYAVCRIKGNIN